MIYDRYNKTYIEEEESKLLKFLYHNSFGRIILKPFTRKWFTNTCALYMNSKLSKHRIKKFIKNNNINMDDYIVDDFKSFDNFFTRNIKKELRPLIKDSDILISPCDSKLSVYKIDDKVNFEIKNSKYNINDLLCDKELASEYNDGYCLVFRLCVDDYHHYHFIDDGKIISTKKIKGKFHTVRPIAHENLKVFSENTREYNVLETTNFGKVIQMEVGALGVGKICNLDKEEFVKGDEKGYFRFGGSTVVLIFKKDKIVLDDDILEATKNGAEVRVKLFEKIGRRN